MIVERKHGMGFAWRRERWKDVERVMAWNN